MKLRLTEQLPVSKFSANLQSTRKRQRDESVERLGLTRNGSIRILECFALLYGQIDNSARMRDLSSHDLLCCSWVRLRPGVRCAPVCGIECPNLQIRRCIGQGGLVTTLGNRCLCWVDENIHVDLTRGLKENASASHHSLVASFSQINWFPIVITVEPSLLIVFPIQSISS